MNTTLDTTTVSRTRRITSSRTAPATTGRPHPVDAPEVKAGGEPIVGKRPASQLTRIVFCVLLGIAACLALVGVVDQASTTSPDDAPPPVIVDFD